MVGGLLAQEIQIARLESWDQTIAPQVPKRASRGVTAVPLYKERLGALKKLWGLHLAIPEWQ